MRILTISDVHANPWALPAAGRLPLDAAVKADPQTMIEAGRIVPIP